MKTFILQIGEGADRRIDVVAYETTFLATDLSDAVYKARQIVAARLPDQRENTVHICDPVDGLLWTPSVDFLRKSSSTNR